MRLFNNKKKNYPVKEESVIKKWKNLVSEYPNREQFLLAWKQIFKYDLNECKVLSVEVGINTGFSVKTPRGITSHGGFGDHIENPIVKSKNDLIYTGCGCTWNTDENGDRFWRVDELTGLPCDLDKAVSIETIRRYVRDNTDEINTLKLKQIN